MSHSCPYSQVAQSYRRKKHCILPFVSSGSNIAKQTNKQKQKQTVQGTKINYFGKVNKF